MEVSLMGVLVRSKVTYRSSHLHERLCGKVGDAGNQPFTQLREIKRL